MEEKKRGLYSWKVWLCLNRGGKIKGGTKGEGGVGGGRATVGDGDDRERGGARKEILWAVDGKRGTVGEGQERGEEWVGGSSLVWGQ